MYSGISELFENQKAYCFYIILYRECKWWNFTRKKQIKRRLEWIYPLMASEIRLLEVTDGK